MFHVNAISRIRKNTDGEGIRTLIALQGCPLRCKYCINKQTRKMDRANGDGTPQQLYDAIRLDRPYFIQTHGGVTFGGGEPLLQVNEIADFVKIVDGKFTVFAETSLNVPEENVLKAAEVIDFFYVDIKTLNARIYSDYTHGELAPVISNLKLLLQKKGPECICVRVPVIPGFTTKKDCDKAVKELKKIGLTKFDVFTYKKKTRDE